MDPLGSSSGFEFRDIFEGHCYLRLYRGSKYGHDVDDKGALLNVVWRSEKAMFAYF